ncbi:MAG: hypothetical protein ACTSWY_06660 [Promethearchaeota archaeon]
MKKEELHAGSKSLTEFKCGEDGSRIYLEKNGYEIKRKKNFYGRKEVKS